MSIPKILWVTLAAMAAGVVVGMLIAPEKGAVLRKNILKKSDDLTDAMEDTVKGKVSQVVEGISARFSRKKESDSVTNSREVEA